MNIFKLIIVVFVLGFAQTSYADRRCDFDVCKLKACKEMDIEKITKAFSYHNNSLGWSALNYAIEKEDYQSAKILCDYQVDIGTRDGLYITNPGSTYKGNALERILHHSQYMKMQKKLKFEQVILIKSLIDGGIDCDFEYESGFGTPLMSLAYFGEIELVGRLLDRNVDVNRQNGGALSMALCTGNTHLVNYLIMRGADVKLINMLHDAILGQKVELVQLAFSYGCTADQFDALKTAINYVPSEIQNLYQKPGSETPALDVISCLLENGIDPNYWMCDALANGKSIAEAYKDSPMKYALNLSKQVYSFEQICYWQCLINLFKTYGAVTDKQ